MDAETYLSVSGHRQGNTLEKKSRQGLVLILSNAIFPPNHCPNKCVSNSGELELVSQKHVYIYILILHYPGGLCSNMSR